MSNVETCLPVGRREILAFVAEALRLTYNRSIMKFQILETCHILRFTPALPARQV